MINAEGLPGTRLHHCKSAIPDLCYMKNKRQLLCL